MPDLLKLGLVRQSLSKSWPRRPIWLLTAAGKAKVKEIGTGGSDE
jgi:hypothetical protein